MPHVLQQLIPSTIRLKCAAFLQVAATHINNMDSTHTAGFLKIIC